MRMSLSRYRTSRLPTRKQGVLFFFFFLLFSLFLSSFPRLLARFFSHFALVLPLPGSGNEFVFYAFASVTVRGTESTMKDVHFSDARYLSLLTKEYS